MTPLDRWWRAQAKAVAVRPSLEEALLTKRAWRYVAYRLRYVMGRAVLRSVLHLAEIVLFARVFTTESIGPILVIRNLSLAFGALWWGALEELRSEVRAQTGAGHVNAARCAVDDWLALALVVALAQQAAGLAWVTWGPSPFRSFSVFDAYVIASCARLGLDTVSRTYHSGVFALRRVFRPWWSLLLVDALDVALVIGLWRWLGLWGFSLTLLAVGTLRAILTLHYARHAYQDSPLPVRRQRTSLLRGLFARSWPWSRMLRDGLGNGVAQLDALMIIALVAGAEGPGVLLLAALLHVLSPLMSAGFAWARVFYFDLKRVELWRLPFLRRRLERLLGQVACWVPLPIGLGSAVLLGLFWRGPAVGLFASVLVFVAVRAWFAARQITAFSFGDGPYLVRLTVYVVVVCGLVAGGPKDPPWVLTLASASLSIALLLSGRPTAKVLERSGPSQPWLSLPHFLERLAAWPGEIRLALARVDRPRFTLSRAAQALRPVLGPGGMTQLGRNHLLWFETSDWASRSLIVRSAAGCFTQVEVSAVHGTGLAALDAGLPSPIWESKIEAPRALLSGKVRDERCLQAVRYLHEAISSEFPQSTVVPLERGVLPTPNPAGWAAREAVRALLGALRGRIEYRPARARPSYVVLCSGAEPLAIVITPASFNEPSPSPKWLVTSLSVAASAPAGPRSSERP